jgi:hypothetical protein
MRGFFVFFKTGMKREKQIGKFFCVCNRTIDKKKKRRRRRRREASFVEAYIPSLQTKLLKFFSFWKDSKLTSFFPSQILADF